ncbi:MAG: rhodanese-like domain-containing protein [Actinomycetota bacterium]|nr:rhodanese-like domain-containing protein [Actinomycetota bacterium]
MPKIIDRREVQRLVTEEGGQIVDVLPPDEYAEEHITGAVSLPLRDLDADTARQRLDQSRPVVTYCHDYL